MIVSGICYKKLASALNEVLFISNEVFQHTVVVDLEAAAYSPNSDFSKKESESKFWLLI